MTRERSLRRSLLLSFLCLLLLVCGAPHPAAAEFSYTTTGTSTSGVIIEDLNGVVQNPNFHGPAKIYFTVPPGWKLQAVSYKTSRVGGFTPAGAPNPLEIVIGDYLLVKADFVPIPFSVTPVIVADNGTSFVDSSCSGTVWAGGSCTLTLKPGPGLTPAEATLGGDAQATLSGGGSSYTVSNVRGDVRVNVSFGYKLTVNATAGAVISRGSSTISSGGHFVVPPGVQPTVVVVPAAGDACERVTTPSGETTPCRPDNSYELAPLTSDGTMTVSTVTGIPVTADSGPHGTVSPSGTTTVLAGSSQSFTFSPDAGYVVDAVYVDTKPAPTDGTSYVLANVTAPHALYVTFKAGGPTMEKYCSAPPFVASGVKSNVLFLIDNSSSMYDLAYGGKNLCVDDGFVAAREYPGYFDVRKNYLYDAAKSRFVVSDLPSLCNAASTPYLCVHMTGVAGSGSRRVQTFAASGSFLNWLSTSKLDLEKQVLTGGKFLFDSGNSGAGRLVGESRGCQGKRYVKLLPSEKITFAVRGPFPKDDGYVYEASQGGATRIEIYDKSYNKEVCTRVVEDWLAPAPVSDSDKKSYKEKLQGEISTCLGNPGGTSRAGIYSVIMGYCYGYLKTSTQLPADSTISKVCTDRVISAYGGRFSGIANEVDDSVCANGIRHATHDSQTTAEFSLGYLGACLTGLAGETAAACPAPETVEYCLELKTPTVTDPAATADSSESKSANIPSYVLQAGISALGDAAGTFLAQAEAPAPPTGQIQAFSDRLNMGAMVFNANGAGSECGDTRNTAEVIPCLAHCSNNPAYECYNNSECTFGSSHGTCDAAPHTDGGRIISYVNGSLLGDHGGTGLIGSIDAITANSWTPFAEAFYDAIGYFANRDDLRLQAGDFDLSLPPSQYSCQKNNVLIVSDGMSTADANTKVNALAALYAPPGGVTGHDNAHNCPAFKGSRSLDDLAWIGAHRDIATFSTSSASDAAPATNSHAITTHVIYLGSDNPVIGLEECDPVILLKKTAESGGGSFVASPDPTSMGNAFKGMLQSIAGGSNSGSDASLLATGDGNGALFLQPIFYTDKSFDGGATHARWLGELQALWYYIDPFLGRSDGSASTIREDTVYAGDKDHYLDLKGGRVVDFSFDVEHNRSEARLYVDGDGDGKVDPAQPPGYPEAKAPDEVQSIWRAGVQLWKRDAAQRTIFTSVDGSTLTDFTTLDPDAAASRALLQGADSAQVQLIRDFAVGKVDGSPSVRDRSVAIAGVDEEERVWKLGDIISSTPKVQSHVSLNSYHLPTPRGYSDVSYRKFISSADYRKRGTVYVGANDGMLHAFSMGALREGPTAVDVSTEEGKEAVKLWPPTRKGALSGTSPGAEAWAFVPKNVLPYLTYLKEPLYPHLYYVDGAVTLSDVSIAKPDACGASSYWDCMKDTRYGRNWRTVLIGGMGLGGATRPKDDTCADGASGSCVKAPLTDAGLSSYFALDVTSQLSEGSSTPGFLWEFAPPGLGFATSGGTVVKISARGGDGKPDRDRNGKWFAVFGSGPTGPLDCTTCQFRGASDQHLKFFVVDLGAQGTPVKGVTWWEIDTGIADAFAGSIVGGGIDADKGDAIRAGYYQDDAVYLGYTRKGEGGEWNRGGVVRLFTREDPNPANWTASTVIDGIGPVTGGIAKLQDRTRHNLWLYFGTGRYWYNQDDMSGGRAIYGIKEPCYGTDPIAPDRLAPECRVSRSVSELTDKTSDSSDALAESRDKGWVIDLEGANIPDPGFGSERSLATPSASTAGAVFFSTFKPSADRCFMGGKSYLWGVKYDTGGALAETAAASNGKALTYLLHRQPRRLRPERPGAAAEEKDGGGHRQARRGAHRVQLRAEAGTQDPAHAGTLGERSGAGFCRGGTKRPVREDG